MMNASGFIDGQLLGRDEVGGVLGLGHVHGDRIGHLEDLGHRHGLDAVQLGGLGRDEGIATDDVHAQRTSAVGHGHADLAQADDAERLVDQLAAHEGGAVPVACVHRGVRGGHATRQREEQGQGVLGGRDGVAGRSVDDRDAGGGGGGDVDVVDADAGTADDDQSLAGGDGLGVGLDAAAHEQGVVLRQGREELVARQAHANVDVVLLLEQGDALGRQLLSNEDAHAQASSPALRAAAGPTPRSMGDARCSGAFLDDLDGADDVVDADVTEVPDAEELALHLALPTGEDQAPGAQLLVDGRPVDAVGHERGGDGVRGEGRVGEELEAHGREAGPRGRATGRVARVDVLGALGLHERRVRPRAGRRCRPRASMASGPWAGRHGA